jgi:hypothetical protein
MTTSTSTSEKARRELQVEGCKWKVARIAGLPQETCNLQLATGNLVFMARW